MPARGRASRRVRRIRAGRRGGLRAVGLALALGALACGPPEPVWPAGAHLVAEGPALVALVEPLAGLEGTPAARQARALSLRLSGCAYVVGHSEAGDLGSLLDALACGDPERVHPALARARGDAQILALLPFASPFASGRRLVVTGGRRAEGGSVLDVRLDPPDLTGQAALLLPGPGSVGAPVLATEAAVVHARVRPRGGLDLAAWVPEGSQGDRLFRLKSALFGSAVLKGVWEAAVYMPEPGHALPPMALALDVRSPARAVEAMAEFLDALEATWPLHPTPARFAAGEGACLFDLRILPEFAPCYVATGRALVVGWNPASVEIALAAGAAGHPDAGPAPDRPSRLDVKLDRMAEADRRLAVARHEGGAPGSRNARTWGWRRLVVVPGAEAGALHLELLPAEPAG